jgi:signal transduction histidine kinase
MGLSQKSENPARPKDRTAAVIKKKTPPDPAGSKTQLVELLFSINHKLDQLTSANQDLFHMIDPSAEGELPADDSVAGGFPQTDVSQEESTEPELAYRLSSLVDFLAQQYQLEECAVFLSRGKDANPEKLVSSGSPAGDQGSNEFDDEIRTLQERGEIARAVGEKRRLIRPARSGGSLLIIPFDILGQEDGFWAARFRAESSPGADSSVELPFWTELISACIENSRLQGPPTQHEEPSCIQTEKLFTTAEISRAVVHEINNCLQVILGRTQLLLMKEGKRQKTSSNRKVLETIETNANRVCSILKDLSDHLHRQSGRASGEGEVNVRRILESNLPFLQYLLKSDRIGLQFDIEENLPPVYWDAGEFELVLLTLIWGLSDQLGAEGSICLQASAVKKDILLKVRCASGETQPGALPDLSDLQSNARFRLASEILNKHKGELKLEESGEREIHLSLTFPVVQERKASPAGLGEPETPFSV